MDGAPPPEEDFSQIPIPERSQHKNWKARLSAYNDVISGAAKTASDTDPFFRPFVSDGSLLKSWCTDANAVAQEKGIEAVLAIVQYSGESSSRTRQDVVPSLVEKSLGATRAGTKRKGMDLCGMYVEVENNGDGVITDLLPGLEAKQPKVVAGCVACLKELIESFGVPSVGNIKPILKTLSKIFGHTDKTVRAEGTALVLALYTFLGPALQPSLSDLKPVQLSELQKSFDSLDASGKGAGTGKPSRFTRKTQREREAQEDAGGPADETAAPEAAPVDPKSFLDPVNALSLFPADLEERLSSTKWKDRVEVLEECNKVLVQPSNAKISDSNVDAYSFLTTTLGTKCKGDANINVVIEAAKLVEGLANGMGKAFGRFRGAIMPGMFERLKERKPSVVDAIGKALDALSGTVPLSDMVDDVLLGLKNKNPQVRENVLKFLHRILTTTTTAPSKDQVQPIAQLLVTLLGDSTEPVRTSAAECLGTMMKILGERAFNPYIENVGELQMTKVKDAFTKAEIKYKAGGGAKPAPWSTTAGGPKPVAKNAPAPKPSASALFDEFVPPAKAPPARFARPTPLAFEDPPAAGPSSPPKPVARAPMVKVKKPVVAPAPAPAAKPAAPAKSGPSKILAISPSEPVKFKMSSEDAAARAADDIPANFRAQLADPAWKARLEAAEEMIKWAEDGGVEKVDSEVLMRFLSKTPGWGEKNFQVSAKIYQIMCIMAEKSPTFGRPTIALSVGHLSEKLGDMKLKKPAGDALTVYAEKTSLAFVLAQAYEPMQKQKAPKAQADAMTWIKQQLTEFGIAGIPLRDLIAFVKKGLQSANGLVRAAATQVLVTVRIFVGADISGFLEDLNPQLLTTINGEFDKVAGQSPPEPTRTSADLRETSGGAKAAGKVAAGTDALDDLIPRVDLDKLVSQTSIVVDSKSDTWKVRKEAFEALNALLEVKSNGRLKSNMSDLGGILKRAMADTNLSVKMLALGIVSKVAIGMGPAFDKYAKLLVGPVASVCADNKASTRTAGVSALGSIADGCESLNSMYTGLGSALETSNPSLRASVLSWMGERFKATPPDKGADLTPLAAPIIACLEDRNADVRKAAGIVLPVVVSNAGYEFVMDQTTNLKPASKATIVPLINNARLATSSATPALASKAHAAPSSPAAKAKARPNGISSPKPGPPGPSRGIIPPARSQALKALNGNSRPATGTSEERPTAVPKTRVLARPTSVASHAESSATSVSHHPNRTLPFTSTSMDLRASRLKKDSARWILEASPKPDMLEYLAVQMEQTVSPELFTSLFSKDHRAEEDFMAGLSTLSEFYSDSAAGSFGLNEDEASAMQLTNVDLTLKYAALKLLANNTQLGVRCLEVITNVVDSMARYNERFSETEAKLWVPALIIKLGDSKFVPKLAPIYENLDKVIPSSQVVQLLVQYGLDDKSAGKTCKNESLGLIEKTCRKRGSILRTRDDRGFYESVAKCISDGGTRNAALSLMALLQLQGGSASLETVISAMPQSSKDMLANRKNTISSTKPLPTTSGLRRPMDSLSDSPVRKGSLAQPSPGLTRTPRAPVGGGSSPAPRGISRAMASPAGRASPSIQRPNSRSSIGSRGGSIQRLNREPDLFGAGPSRPVIQAPSRSIATGPLGPSRSLATPIDPVISAINSVRNEDPDRSVDALKIIQTMLSSQPEVFLDNIQSLVDALLDELDRAFTPLDNLHDSHFFRLVKHILQTFNTFSTNQDLVRRLNYDDIYSILSTLSLHMVQADPMGGNIQELTRFINMLLIQLLAAPERKIVFKAMFTLLLDLTRDFAANRTPPEAEAAAHADLVIKCLWKRCKILDDDLRNGRMAAGTLLGILEEFMQTVGPAEYRRRAMDGIALGEMPLRTVKAVIQKVVFYAKETGQEIYDILLIEFGDTASDTVIYPYVFRLAGLEANRPSANPGRTHSPPTTSRPTSTTGQSRVVSGSSGSEENSASPVKQETEAERLVRNIHVGQQEKRIDELYQFIQAAPANEAEVQAAMTSLLSLPVATFIRRALASRSGGDNVHSPGRSEKSISQSPTRPDSVPSRSAIPTRTNGTRPTSLNVDKGASTDDQIAQYKNFFNRAPAGARRYSPLEEGVERNGVPLNEIAPPQQRLLD